MGKRADRQMEKDMAIRGLMDAIAKLEGDVPAPGEWNDMMLK